MVDYYSAQAISAFNQNPPTDDGAQTAANEITWAKHRDKLATPVKNLAEAIDSELANMSARMFLNGISAKSTNYTLLTTDLGTLISASNSITVTALAAATAGAGYLVGVLNTGATAVTIAVPSGETLNGTTDGTLIIYQNDMVLVRSDASGWRAWRMNAQHTSEIVHGHTDDTNTAGGVTAYFSEVGGSATENNIRRLAGRAFTVFGIHASVTVAPGGSETVICTVRKTNTDTAVTVTITGAAATNSSEANEVVFAATDFIDTEAVWSASAATSAVRVVLLLRAIA